MVHVNKTAAPTTNSIVDLKIFYRSVSLRAPTN
jgi:hypothetical protein